MAQKKIENFEQAKKFFRPSLTELYDPFLMQGMNKAVQRIEAAIQKKEKILIYGDYDVDGITAVSMVYNFLQGLPEEIIFDFYIPDRLKEGYGISQQGVRWAAEKGFTLLISLDCGIKGNDCIAEAYELGIDTIVCDHHEPGNILPKAYAILNPKQLTCPYPFKELSGCGVGFKLLQALAKHKLLDELALMDYLDLVVVSIACDLVPIVDENRILAHYGIQILEKSPQPGLRSLMELEGITPPISMANIAFKIGPRINATGRVGHASLAVSALISKERPVATGSAHMINQQNSFRKDIDTTTTEEALGMINQNIEHKKGKTTVLFNESWHKGVIGIVASRCIEHYYRPTVILTASGNKVTGSARSVAGYNLYEAIESCSHLLEQYGGHAYAAGLTMPLAHVDSFQAKFEEVVSNTIQDELLIPRQVIDLTIDFAQITPNFYNVLRQMGPFGVGNRHAVFMTKNVYTHYCNVIKGKHLKLRLHQGNGKILEAIGFGLAQYEELTCSGKPFHIAYTIEENWYLGRCSLQLNIKDIQL